MTGAWRPRPIVLLFPVSAPGNLDLYQEEIAGIFKKEYRLPVFYFTELIGLALQLKGLSRGLKRHMVNPLLKEKGLITG